MFFLSQIWKTEIISSLLPQDLFNSEFIWQFKCVFIQSKQALALNKEHSKLYQLHGFGLFNNSGFQFLHLERRTMAVIQIDQMRLGKSRVTEKFQLIKKQTSRSFSLMYKSGGWFRVDTLGTQVLLICGSVNSIHSSLHYQVHLKF